MYYKLMDEEEMEEMTEAVEVADGGVSVKDTIVNIISDNIVTPFMNNDLLLLLFLGILLGAGISILQDKYPVLRSAFIMFKDLFLTLLEILCKLIPLAVFCNMACLVYATGTDVLLSILSYVALCAVGIVCMIVIYNILILLLARINPLVFTRHYFKVMLTALTLSSSVVIPITLSFEFELIVR